jgi:hypothetical protein
LIFMRALLEAGLLALRIAPSSAAVKALCCETGLADDIAKRGWIGSS